MQSIEKWVVDSLVGASLDVDSPAVDVLGVVNSVLEVGLLLFDTVDAPGVTDNSCAIDGRVDIFTIVLLPAVLLAWLEYGVVIGAITIVLLSGSSDSIADRATQAHWQTPPTRRSTLTAVSRHLTFEHFLTEHDVETALKMSQFTGAGVAMLVVEEELVDTVFVVVSVSVEDDVVVSVYVAGAVLDVEDGVDVEVKVEVVVSALGVVAVNDDVLVLLMVLVLVLVDVVVVVLVLADTVGKLNVAVAAKVAVDVLDVVVVMDDVVVVVVVLVLVLVDAAVVVLVLVDTVDELDAVLVVRVARVVRVVVVVDDEAMVVVEVVVALLWLLVVGVEVVVAELVVGLEDVEVVVWVLNEAELSGTALVVDGDVTVDDVIDVLTVVLTVVLVLLGAMTLSVAVLTRHLPHFKRL